MLSVVCYAMHAYCGVEKEMQTTLRLSMYIRSRDKIAVEASIQISILKSPIWLFNFSQPKLIHGRVI